MLMGEARQRYCGRMPEITIRPATMDDAEALFAWRNDELTREMSTTPDAVDLEGHVGWLGRRLADPDCRFWIAETDGEPAGTIRFEGTEPATVSWTVAPGFRGRGVAKEMARLGMEREGHVIAHVKAENCACHAVLAAVGFRLVEDGEMQLWEHR